jgi:membrane protein
MDDPAPRPTRSDRAAAVKARGVDLALRLLDEVPSLRRLLAEIGRVEFLDRSLVIASQALFSVTPLVVVVAAFSPEEMADNFLRQVGETMGISGGDTAAMQDAANIERVQTQTGVLGAVIVLISALSFARAMQRLYLRVWEVPRERRGVANVRLTAGWLVGWLLGLIFLTSTIGVFDSDVIDAAAHLVREFAAFALWWWTAHTLLAGRVSWRSLWLTALLCSIVLGIVIDASRIVMPPYVKANTDQFGGIGLMFAASTWLLVIGCVITGSAIVGRVVVEEPRLRPPLHWIERQVWDRWHTGRA